jgi:outer membrane immunogenic protein
MRHWRGVSALAVGAYLGLSGMASAADLPFKALPPPVPLFVWTGFYGGANVAYSWGSSLATSDVTLLAATYSDGVTHRGWEASVEGGYCYQQSPTTNFVACLEVRYDFPAERGSTTYIPIPGAPVTNTDHIDPLLIGPHLGFTTNANRTLWYAAGGLAIGQVSGNSVAIGPAGAGNPTANPPSAWATGWFVGAGMEQMLSNNWGLKVEYDYVHLNTGGITAQYTGGTPATTDFNYPGFPATATLASHPFDNVVTAGINYHFH